MPKQANKQPSVADAERTLAAFEIERNDLLDRQAAVADKRRLGAFDAHNGDAQAKKLLDGLHDEVMRFQSRLAGLDDAIAEAKRRLQQARDVEANAEARGHAQAIRDEWTAGADDFADVDKSLNLAADAMAHIFARYERMRAHGLVPPPQLPLMMVDVVTGYLMRMPQPVWKQLNFSGLEHLPPHRRRSAMLLRDLWNAQTERQAATIGGEQLQQTNTKEVA